MCGIAGVRRFGDTPITGEEIVLLLCSIEHRGQHATGIALENPDGIVVYKAAQPAWQFTKSEEFRQFLFDNLTEYTRTALLHTRWYTVGSPEINENNHPMWDGETAAIHNGSISNHDTLFTSGNYTRSCETDSDIIRAIVSAHGINKKGLRELSKMAGSAAISVVSTKFPGKLLLARSGSPLCYGFDQEGDKLYWASEVQAIMKASRPFELVRGVWVQNTRSNISVGNMPNDTAWIFGEEVLELHGEFKTCSFYRAPDYSRGRESYHSKMKAAKNEANRKKYVAKTEPVVVVGANGHRNLPALPRTTVNPLVGAVVKCPKCDVGNINSKGVPWGQLVCSACDAPLGD